MVQHLPDVPDDPALIRVRTNSESRAQQSRGCVYLTVLAERAWQPGYEGRRDGYVVVLHLKSDDYPTFWWNNTFSLADLDKSIELYERQHPEAAADALEPTEEDATVAPEERDDDRTDIEKAARRALHGDSGLTAFNKAGQQKWFGSPRLPADLRETLRAISDQLGATADLLETVGRLLGGR
jgi:hypothetical protein